MHRRIGGLCVVVLAAGLTDCASTSVSTDRRAGTGIAAGESVAVIAAGPQKCADEASKDCPNSALAGALDSEFEHCLASAMQSERSDLAVIRAADLRRAFPQTRSQDFPRSVEALIPLLQNDGFRQGLTSLRLRYVLVVQGSTTTGSSQLQGVSPFERRDAIGLWAIGGEWDRYSSITAEVIDLVEARHSGKLMASSRGKAGFSVPVFVIIPLPPVPYSAPTETEACSALGKAVVAFLLHRDK